MKRNREMVPLSRRIIAVYDGRCKGGTVFTMREAAMLKRDIRVIKL
jgi:predicted Rossmann fold nucleotide-binding protein DprA/Smf involved in DNA uptake